VVGKPEETGDAPHDETAVVAATTQPTDGISGWPTSG
jgi:hypothetical protein